LFERSEFTALSCASVSWVTPEASSAADLFPIIPFAKQVQNIIEAGAERAKKISCQTPEEIKGAMRI